MTRICNDLIEAYKGYYEDELEGNYTNYVRQEIKAKQETVQDQDDWNHDRVIKMIGEHTPEQRLAVYLEWNGIIGYTQRIFDIAIGKINYDE